MENKAIIINSHGDESVLEYQTLPTPKPKAGQVLIKQTAVGLNFIDTYFRSGFYPTPPFPVVLGAEAAGTIAEIGEGVTGFEIGQRVCYTGGLGSYCTYRAINADEVIPLPDGVSEEVAAACLLKGLTAQYLLRRTFKVGPEHSIFYHAAAGGVGLIFGQWAHHLGAKVIGTAGGAEKCALAKAHGFDEVIDYKAGDFVKPALELNGGKKYDVVYDSVGKDTFDGSFNIIKPLGLFVSFGQSSGAVPPFDIGLLNRKGSLFVTRPNLFAYNPDRATLLESAGELFDLIAKGIIKIEINQKYALSDVATAHKDLTSRKTTGASVLVV